MKVEELIESLLKQNLTSRVMTLDVRYAEITKVELDETTGWVIVS